MPRNRGRSASGVTNCVCITSYRPRAEFLDRVAFAHRQVVAIRANRAAPYPGSVSVMVAPSESHLALVRRARRIDRELGRTYPNARCELDFRNPFELLVAAILSAQCTDVRVNLVTPALFARYPDACAFAAANRADLEEMIKSTGFFRAKANSIIGSASVICTDYSGVVPRRLEQLVALPGVGRKTANVVLGDGYGIPGITVDTHVGRLSRRFGWTSQFDPDQVEQALMGLFPRRDWIGLSHHLVIHGRRCCHARKPACGACPVAPLCPAFGTGPTDPDEAATLIKTGPDGG